MPTAVDVWLRGAQNKAFFVSSIGRKMNISEAPSQVEDESAIADSAAFDDVLQSATATWERAVAQADILDRLLARFDLGSISTNRGETAPVVEDGTQGGGGSLVSAASPTDGDEAAASARPGIAYDRDPGLFLGLPYKEAAQLLESWGGASGDSESERFGHRARLEAVAAARHAHARVVLDAPVSKHSVAACIRTLDCFGVPMCDIVACGRPRRQRQMRPGSGAEPYVRQRHWSSPEDCLATMRSEGCVRFLALVDPQSARATEVPPIAAAPLPEGDGPLVLLVGDEAAGVSPAFEVVAGASVARIGSPPAAGGSGLRANLLLGAALAVLDARGGLGDEAYPLEEQHALVLSWMASRSRLGWRRALDELRRRLLMGDAK